MKVQHSFSYNIFFYFLIFFFPFKVKQVMLQG